MNSCSRDPGRDVDGCACVARLRPDSPWCPDDNSCPSEVCHDGRMYVVTCTDRVAASLRDERLVVLFHDGVDDAERMAWTVEGVPVEQVLVLPDESDEG